MKSQRRTLVESVTQLAEATFDRSKNTSFEAWREHWNNTAERMQKHFEKEGLVETAKALERFRF